MRIACRDHVFCWAHPGEIRYFVARRSDSVYPAEQIQIQSAPPNNWLACSNRSSTALCSSSSGSCVSSDAATAVSGPPDAQEAQGASSTPPKIGLLASTVHPLPCVARPQEAACHPMPQLRSLSPPRQKSRPNRRAAQPC